MEYKKNIVLDYLHTFFRNTNFTHAIWMVYLASKGLNLIEIGVLESVFHVTSLSMEVPTGMIADLYGRKVSRVLGIFSYVIYVILMITTTNYILLVAAFVFCGLSFTFESGSGEAMVYDSLIKMCEKDRFMKVNGNKEVIYQIASTISLFIGGMLAMVYLELSFLLTLVLMLAALIVIILMKEVTIETNKVKVTFVQSFKNHFIVTLRAAFTVKRAFLLIVIGALFAAPITTLFLYMQNYLQSNGYDFWQIGYVLSAHAFFGALGGIFAFALEKKYKEKKILYFAPFFIVIAFWAITFDTYIYIPFALIGFFDSILFVVLGDYLNKIIPSDIRASVLSVGGLMFSFIMIIIFPIIGYVGEHFGLEKGFVVLAMIVTIFYVLLLIIIRGNHLVENGKDDLDESSNLSLS